MREIEFRAKPCYADIHSDTWVYGTFQYLWDCSIVDNTINKVTPRLDKGLIVNKHGETEVLLETLGQFTGIYDKHGNKIYEGDIVECVSWNEYFANKETGEVMEPFRRRMYVDLVVECGAFKLIEPMPEPMSNNVWDMIGNGDVKIIGNIYNDYGLLKKKMW